tara:strand:+ start:1657 stop:2595 length:939 start_codon:yes stop_codon:yes gene_type:complete
MFSNNRRKKLMKLLPEVAREERVFEDIFSRFAEHRRHLGEHRIDTAMEVSAEQKTIEELLNRLKVMVDDDVALVHLLFQMYRRGEIEDSDGLIQTAKSLLRNTKKAYRWLFVKHKSLHKRFMIKKGRIGIWVGPLGPRLTEFSNQYKQLIGMLNIIVQTEHSSLEDIERELRQGLKVSDKVKFVDTEGSMRVELHLGYRKYMFDEEGNGHLDQKYVVPTLLVHDHDYLVAEVKLRKFARGAIEVWQADVFLRGRGYFQRVIELLLNHKRINKWISDSIRSRFARRMYERIAEDSHFRVQPISDDRLMVTRAE